MARLHQQLDHILEDKRITPNEVQLIQDYIAEDGELDFADVRYLVELLAGANEVCPEFDDLFFPVLKSVLLEDGRIDSSEQYSLLKMLYSDGEIRPNELKFLMELRQEAREISAEFEELCKTAHEAHPTEWSLGGAAAGG
jgi:hypothetical protein